MEMLSKREGSLDSPQHEGAHDGVDHDGVDQPQHKAINSGFALKPRGIHHSIKLPTVEMLSKREGSGSLDSPQHEGAHDGVDGVDEGRPLLTGGVTTCPWLQHHRGHQTGAGTHQVNHSRTSEV